MQAVIQSQVSSIPLELCQRLDYFALSDELVAFKLEWEPVFQVERVPASVQKCLPIGVKQGFADVRAMAAYAAGRCSAYTRKAAAAEAGIRYSAEELKVEPSASFSLVPLSYLEFVQAKGFTAGAEAEEATDAERMGLYEHHAYDFLRDAKASLNQVVRIDYASHMLFDMSGQPLPVAMPFGYIDGRICDGRYDLERLVEHLRADPRVRFMNEASPLHLVPYYNVSPGCSQHVPFVFSPTAQDMQNLWPVMCQKNRKYPSVARYEAMFELDVLGLRAAGIARFAGFHDSQEVPATAFDDE